MRKLAFAVLLGILSSPVLISQEGDAEPRATKTEINEEARPEAPKPILQEWHPGEVRTIFDPRSGSGGYGALSIGYTSINGRDALLMGGRGEWIIGHGFGLGLGGYGFVNDPIQIANANYSLAGGYGGLIMEPILLGSFPVHLAFPILLGAGGVANSSYSFSSWHNFGYDSYVEDAAVFFVAEAGLELEFNLIRFFRMSLFGTYRYTSDIQLRNVSKDALMGWNTGLTFKFGSF